MKFSHIELARTHVQAFEAARKEALYLYGHGRKTDTIGDKTHHKYVGELASWYLDHIDSYWAKAERWVRLGKRASVPSTIPPGAAPLFAKAIEWYLDPNGPAVCFEITGSKAKEIKEAEGRKGTWDRVYWFGGTV